MLYVNPMEMRQPLPADGAGLKNAKQKQSLEEFERLFLYQLLREMRKTVPEDGLLGSSQEQSFFEEIMDDHLAGQMAKSGQLGIAAQIEQQLNQAGQPRPLHSQDAAKGFLLHPGVEGLPLEKGGQGMPLGRQATPVAPLRGRGTAFRL
jgi:flagellar protein FlgJ